jgi:hypothetical protein
MRNVPGVAIYMACLTQLRSWMATSPYFAGYRRPFPDNPNASVLPKLTNTGNLLAGATTRVTVGLLLNPFSVLKARYEVRYCICQMRPTPAYVEARVICTRIKALEARSFQLHDRVPRSYYEVSRLQHYEMRPMQVYSLYSTKASNVKPVGFLYFLVVM